MPAAARHMDVLPSSFPTPPPKPGLAKPSVGPMQSYGTAKTKAKAKVSKAKSEHASERRGGEPNFQPMDPLSTVLIPISRRQAAAYPYMGMIKDVVSLPTTAGFRTLYVITNTGHSATVMGAITTAPFQGVYTIPAISGAPASGGPSSGRAMKASVEITNTTAAMTAGGSVYVLKTDQRVSIPGLPTSLTAAQINTLCDSVKDHPLVKPFDGADFKKTDKHGRHPTFMCDVVDGVDYENFSAWQGAESIDGFFGHVFTWPGLDSNTHERPMSTIFVLFETPVATQTYAVSARASYYTRWSLATVPGQTQMQIPIASLDRINALTTTAPDGLSGL